MIFNIKIEMINKRRSLDPKKINNYNHFLSTLDQSSNICIDMEFDNKLLYRKNANSNSKNNIYTKSDIDKLIDDINSRFKNINDCSSSFFTGNTSNDILLSHINIQDPNVYSNENDKYNLKSIFTTMTEVRRRKKIKSFSLERKERDELDKTMDPKEDIIPEIKKVYIDTEINTISDILNLIQTYPIDDPLIEYNINMQSLHNIKESLEELNNMIGMNELKTNIVDQIIYFVQELHKNKNTSGDFMHTVIYGPPGTGKTEIAKMMGKIYSKIGILNKGTFKKVTRSDLIAGYLGQTALKTRDVINEALGGVLFIDEAYSLGNSEKRDSFSKECIDTLCEALSDNKENLMVIIAGYEKELKDCFFNYNQGLDSRFTWRFKTDEYNHEDLYNIFIKKVKDIGWELEENSEITSEWFKKNKDYFKFFGRDIETILAKTKIAHSKRIFCRPANEKKKINLKDLNKGLEIYIKNEDTKHKKEDEYFKKQLHYSLYS